MRMKKSFAANVRWQLNPRVQKTGLTKTATFQFSPTVTRIVRKFHQTLPGFQPTPLAKLDELAASLGIAAIWIKDESLRCGLNAFKVLGAAFALCHALARRFDRSPEDLTFADFQSREFRQRLNDITCISATDGNHGRAVAWAARQLGCRAVIYMPQGTAAARLESIKRLDADVRIIAGNYDDAVKQASRHAAEKGWLLIQDTAGTGNAEIPIRVMQGYLTMFDEAFEQLDGQVPTHVFIQCGVGSLAGSLQAYLVERFGDERPLVTVVEPIRAACYYESMLAGDGRPHKVEGDLDTIMAGLACGEPNPLSWDILRDFADAFVACPDAVTVTGMRVLGNPLGGDARVVSGESGAVTLGLLLCLLEKPELDGLKKALKIGPGSSVLLFSTEGDTDPEMYRKIVRGG